MLHIYTGNGKGKTTAAFGLALRAAGYGMYTYIGQFMKARETGEILAVKNIPFITVEQFGPEMFCFKKKDISYEHIEAANKGLKKCKEVVFSGKYDIVIMDEINVVIYYDMIDLSELMNIVNGCPERTELVFTGRYANKMIIEKADLVSEIIETKHYYSKQISARKGIEF